MPKTAKPKKLRTSVALTPDGIRILKALAVKLGGSEGVVVEIALRDLAKKHKVE